MTAVSEALDRRILVQSFGCTTGYMMRTHSGDSGVMLLGEITPPCSPMAVGQTPLDDATWHQVTAVYDRDGDLTVYVDGNVDGSVSIAFTLGASVSNSNNPRIGIDDASFFEPFNGLIDEVRVWNRALSQAEIQGTMCAPLSGTEPGLAGYWPLESDFNDYSSNGNHGTPNGNVLLVLR